MHKSMSTLIKTMLCILTLTKIIMQISIFYIDTIDNYSTYINVQFLNLSTFANLGYIRMY